jgi:hypothetical protein
MTRFEKWMRQKRLEKWIRMKIAEFLDRREDTCWAELAMWALFPECHDFREIFDGLPRRGGCERRDESNYCGKCSVMKVNDFIRGGQWIAYPG